MANRAPQNERKRKSRTQFFKTVRWLHIYISTTLFTLLLFFAVTGITLNNGWYNAAGNSAISDETSLDQLTLTKWSLVGTEAWQPNLTLISAHLAQHYGLNDISSVDIDVDNQELYIEYHLPAGGASVFISSADKLLIVDAERGSVLGILNDLHKGRHSGAVWKWLIDISAVLMLFFAITGLVLLFHGKKHQTAGLVATVLGTVSPIFIYVLFVPAIG